MQGKKGDTRFLDESQFIKDFILKKKVGEYDWLTQFQIGMKTLESRRYAYLGVPQSYIKGAN